MRTVVSIYVMMFLVIEFMLRHHITGANDSRKDRHKRFTDGKENQSFDLQQNYANISLLDSKRLTNFTTSTLMPPFSSNAYKDLVMLADEPDVAPLTHPENVKTLQTQTEFIEDPLSIDEFTPAYYSTTLARVSNFISKSYAMDYDHIKKLIKSTVKELRKKVSVRAQEVADLGIFAFKRLRVKVEEPGDELVEYSKHLASQIESTARKDTVTAKEFAKSQVIKINNYVKTFTKELHNLALTFSKRVVTYKNISSTNNMFKVVKLACALLTNRASVATGAVKTLSTIAVERIQYLKMTIITKADALTVDVYNNITIFERNLVYKMQELERICFKQLENLGNSEKSGKFFHTNSVNVEKWIKEFAPVYYMKFKAYFNKEVKNMIRFCTIKIKEIKNAASQAIQSLLKM